MNSMSVSSDVEPLERFGSFLSTGGTVWLHLARTVVRDGSLFLVVTSNSGITKAVDLFRHTDEEFFQACDLSGQENDVPRLSYVRRGVCLSGRVLMNLIQSLMNLLRERHFRPLRG